MSNAIFLCLAVALFMTWIAITCGYHPIRALWGDMKKTDKVKDSVLDWTPSSDMGRLDCELCGWSTAMLIQRGPPEYRQYAVICPDCEYCTRCTYSTPEAAFRQWSRHDTRRAPYEMMEATKIPIRKPEQETEKPKRETFLEKLMR